MAKMITRQCQACDRGFRARATEARRGGAKFCSPKCSAQAQQIPLEERFWAKIRKNPDGCWEWQGARSNGYGRIGAGGRAGKLRVASQVAWELTHGAIPEGLHVLHDCDNPPCCRPDHLFLGTDADNTWDMMAKGRGRFGHMVGSRNGRAKLADAAVVEIRRRWTSPSRPTRAALAREFGVGWNAVDDIITYRKWAHLSERAIDVAVEIDQERVR